MREDKARCALRMKRAEKPPSAAFFAAGHDGGVQALAEPCGQVVNFVRAVDFDRFAGGVERDFAVLAALQVVLQLGAHLGRHRVVDQVVE